MNMNEEGGITYPVRKPRKPRLRFVSLISFAKRVFTLQKRQKYVIAVLILSAGLFFFDPRFGTSGIVFPLILSFITLLFLLWANYQDIKENFSPSVFILPFFYTLAFGFFYFLVPTRFLAKIGLTSLYAIGLYSLFLSQNILTVASIRTIALLSGARIVSFVITLLSFFFLTNIIFTLDLSIVPTSLLVFLCSFPLIHQSIWTITLDKSVYKTAWWVFILSLSLFESGIILWFWPTSPTVVAIFLTGLFYIIVGITQVWLDKRLFRGVMWEYIWVAIIVFSVLLVFTSWKG